MRRRLVEEADDTINQIKRQAIKGVYSDDDLMERLVLKGGNLIDLIFGISTRASNDLDFSMQGEFESVDQLQSKLAICLGTALEPPTVSEDRKHFWGGYRAYFKLIPGSNSADASVEERRRKAISLAPSGSTRFRIDISKHEYCEDRRRHMLDGYVIYTYSPELFVAEKLRAICQQHQTYSTQMQRHRSARAKDFVDICCIIDRMSVDVTTLEFLRMVDKVFEQKNVPIELLQRIREDREFHRPDFVSVQATVKPGVHLLGFDEYFDRVATLAEDLHSLGHE
jgi:predicted nucleotidyltransferase component of viral defense system